MVRQLVKLLPTEVKHHLKRLQSITAIQAAVDLAKQQDDGGQAKVDQLEAYTAS